MSDLIDRQVAIDTFKKELTVGESKGNYVTICSAVGYEGAKQILESLPSAEPVRMKGEWIYGENDGQDGWFCSKCRFFIPWDYDYYGLNNIDFIKEFHVCPHCKAEMVTYTGKKEDMDE